MYLKTLTHTFTLLTSIFFLFILNFYIEVDVHEVAHAAPSNLMRRRSRGIRKETEDDNLLCKQIRKGTSSAGLHLLRTEDQKRKFNEFKDSKFVNSFMHKLSVK